MTTQTRRDPLYQNEAFSSVATHQICPGNRQENKQSLVIYV